VHVSIASWYGALGRAQAEACEDADVADHDVMAGGRGAVHGELERLLRRRRAGHPPASMPSAPAATTTAVRAPTAAARQLAIADSALPRSGATVAARNAPGAALESE
jgi:hypothetical protein